MAESKIQDPKYIIIDGVLANAATREFIPEDEPLFIIRGKDRHAVKAIKQYLLACKDQDHRDAVLKRCFQFDEFAEDNPDRMGEPDTDGANNWPELGPEAK